MNRCYMIMTIAAVGWKEPSVGSGLEERNGGCLRLGSIGSVWNSGGISISDDLSVTCENFVPVEIS